MFIMTNSIISYSKPQNQNVALYPSFSMTLFTFLQHLLEIFFFPLTWSSDFSFVLLCVCFFVVWVWFFCVFFFFSGWTIQENVQ